MSACLRFTAMLVAVALTACAQHVTSAERSPCDQPAREVITVHDARYLLASSQRLDLYLPWHEAGEPVVVFAHGGGWAGGGRRSYAHIGMFFARCGIAFANVDYPLVPQARADAQAAAILAAARWVAGRAAIYGYAADRLVLMGHSAGAEIVSLAAVDSRLAKDRDRLNIAGVVAVSGLGYELPTKNESRKLPAYIVALYRGAFGPDASHWARFDVAPPPRAREPAFLVVHARDDTYAPERDSAALVRALQRSGVAVGYLQPAGRDHNSVIAEIARDADDPTGIAVERFVFGGSP